MWKNVNIVFSFLFNRCFHFPKKDWVVLFQMEWIIVCWKVLRQKPKWMKFASLTSALARRHNFHPTTSYYEPPNTTQMLIPPFSAQAFLHLRSAPGVRVWAYDIFSQQDSAWLSSSHNKSLRCKIGSTSQPSPLSNFQFLTSTISWGWFGLS